MREIQIIVNERPYNVSAGSDLESIIKQFSLPEIGCVFAINNTVVPRSEWCTTCLSEGDTISLFQAIAGG
ncbi:MULTISPECIES: sulfur carrier protein ThiS [Vibrio]|uniref:sulfur carrier protein ThiS n=1 Tax=Vibrio TaxID=662 RepID=UPI0020754413|nr:MULTISPECIES: sulfur carrier protein ThiS [Vibrio]USD34116.1 sulfur carrier protein ThiS [Vibrio sp. SCSIO 43186]USD47189.1 sulfur carrier protein ThiS [Vibrio sp. SCSIO 43145]USD71241.1 sulfur carrier protein ThiS [Vibrio sp. SCSIO 43139]USD97523.1 thiamine biosynthesis protein ThiS [Vibrio coralliilyticus]